MSGLGKCRETRTHCICGWERVKMDYVATKSIIYVEGFKLVLGSVHVGIQVNNQGQKCISAAGDTLWVAIVDISGGPGKLRKTQSAQGNRGCSRDFREKIKMIKMGGAGKRQI